MKTIAKLNQKATCIQVVKINKQSQDNMELSSTQVKRELR